MAKQSELEIIANDERTKEFVKSPYTYNEATPYSDAHPDALADGDSKGKGTGTPSTYLSLNGVSKGKHDDFKGWGITVNTDVDSGAGNSYDINGTKGVDKAFQGDSGRNYLSLGGINAYNPNNEYGPGSVDTTKSVSGQYWVQ